MLKNIILLIAIACVNTTAFAQLHIGEFKGFQKISNEISYKIFGKPGFQLTYALNNIDNLSELLGEYVNSDSGSDYSNGTPNGINTFLYELAAFELSHRIFQICEGKTSFDAEISIPDLFGPPTKKPISLAYKTEFINDVNTLCQWPDDKVNWKSAFYKIWLTIMGYEASQQDFEQMYDFIVNHQYSDTNKNMFETLFVTMFLHPSFLLDN